MQLNEILKGNNMNEQDIENEIVAKGLTAPRVTLQGIKDKIKHESPNVRLQLLNEFNRYHSIRTSFFKQNKIDYIETENFEGLVINELKSVIKTIFQKG